MCAELIYILPGLASLDHGYARFTHVRIPRTHMFSKFAEVTEGGQYIQPLNPKHSFGGVCSFGSSKADLNIRISPR